MCDGCRVQASTYCMFLDSQKQFSFVLPYWQSPYSTPRRLNGGGPVTRENGLLFLCPSTGFLLCILGDWMAKVLITSESDLPLSVSKKKRKITWTAVIIDSIYWTQAIWLTVGRALCIHYSIYYSQRQLHTLILLLLHTITLLYYPLSTNEKTQTQRLNSFLK